MEIARGAARDATVSAPGCPIERIGIRIRDEVAENVDAFRTGRMGLNDLGRTLLGMGFTHAEVAAYLRLVESTNY